MDSGKEIGAWVALHAVPAGLVARGAGVAHLPPAKLPDDPVAALDKAFGGLIHVRRFFQHLQRLRYEPFRGNLATITGNEAFTPLMGGGVHAVSLRLGRVVLPKLGPGMWPISPFRKHTKWTSISRCGQH